MKVGVVDNYDSFTYNLVHYIEGITGENPKVMLNDKINWEQLDGCTHIILSPGPGLPADSGQLMQVLDRYFLNKKILGVCLGMQAIGLHVGAALMNLNTVHHGEQSLIQVIGDYDGLYHELPHQIEVGRYHSWVVNPDTLPSNMVSTALDMNGELMSFKHMVWPVAGVQFHPESVMTPMGKKILQNWIFRY